MVGEPQGPMKDKNYDLIWVLEASLKNVWQLETYIQDADQAGDSELAEWFRKIQENNRKAGDQGKRMLMERLQREES
ncbi:hypothetical protein ACFQ36_08680 [Arthrobacter sp. GCM10027362]|uniref:hypothetical protein n=1 Tax=Arthrobacter sp. GCM10027362 TaxID=3273379 RepID=UPI00363FEA58